MRPPNAIEEYVTGFSRRIVPNGNIPPFYVECRPLQGAPQSECFPVVESHTKRHGGKMGLGWAIWERPGVFIEAEFHAIWKSPGGAFFDITPRPFNFSRILFLPDVRRLYEGVQVDNVREPLVDDPDVDHFLALFSERFKILNEGELKHQHGMVKRPAKLTAVNRKIMASEFKLLMRYGFCCRRKA